MEIVMKDQKISPEPMFANLAGHYVSSDTYILYEKYHDFVEFIPFPFDILAKIFSKTYLNNVKRLALRARCHSIILRDRTETEFEKERLNRAGKKV
jgi:hypothetical protein